MDCSMVTPKTCILKVNLHCSACEKRVQKVLQKVNGVCSVSIDGEHGKVTVSGIVDPHTLIVTLGKAGKRAELVSVHSQPVNNQNHSSQSSQGIDHPHMGSQIDQLHQLSKLKNLKQVELTHSKTVRMKFRNQSDDSGQKNDTQITKTATNNVHRAGGPSAAVVAPRCGGHVASSAHYGCLDADSSCSASRPSSVVPKDICNGCRPPHGCTCRPAAPPPAFCDHCEPKPPSYPGIFSDDNPHGCRLM